MATFHKMVLEFNRLLSHQKFIEALDFYDDDVVASDNLNAPVKGKSSLRKQMEDFIENATIEAIEVVSLSSEDNLSFTNWYYSFDIKYRVGSAGTGFRYKDGRTIKLSRSIIFTVHSPELLFLTRS
ncbi:nuclear transport factor 2 family protein [Arcticibacter sp. MXS-1]|uniref:nuclear transport factor 2 family protein n=1 Tax=Arcticibacter sp. MXS-1 TaxID=3341726 RepID=UPI0035A83987